MAYTIFLLVHILTAQTEGHTANPLTMYSGVQGEGIKRKCHTGGALKALRQGENATPRSGACLC